MNYSEKIFSFSEKAFDTNDRNYYNDNTNKSIEKGEMDA